MAEKEQLDLVRNGNKTPGVRKDRVNDTCDLQAWYFQTDKSTLAFARLMGQHGIRPDIPALRTYYVTKGNAIFTINGEDYPVGEGEVVQIDKGSDYDLRSKSKDEPVEFFVDIGVVIDIDKIPSK